ncbi:MAG: class I SAM-dependent methyltransferase [bacterium]|nr:class I SAM-dependent methyltransferase [bacterium]
MPSRVDEIRDFLNSINFRFIQPNDYITYESVSDIVLKLERHGVSLTIDSDYFPLDIPILTDEKRKKIIALEFLNTYFLDYEIYRERIEKIALMPRMASFSVGAIINRIVSDLDKDEVFLNIGVWCGFSLISGMVGNPNKICIGVDNFSQFSDTLFGHPRDIFSKFFQIYGTNHHSFFEMDYVDYFRRVHKDFIGFYYYDGEHSYENQLKSLELADPYLKEGGIILVDDTNLEDVSKATYDFIRKTGRRYEIIFQRKTAQNEHITFWNGIMVLQKIK